MNTEINSAMNIVRNFSEANMKADRAKRALNEMNFVGTIFVTPQQKEIINAALKVLDNIQSKSTHYEAMEYFEKTKHETVLTA